jgi:hypothetical protein
MAIGWTLALLVALSIPADVLPPANPALSPDKVVHVVLFCVLGLLWLRAARALGGGRRLRPAEACAVLAGGALFAVATELYQHLAPVRRHGDAYDAGANVAGLLIALAVHWAYVRRAEPHQTPTSDTPSATKES